MSEPSDLERRVSALETRLDEVAADATAARHLAAAGDRDLSDLTVKVEALRSALNGLSVQTAEQTRQLRDRMDALEDRLAQLEARVSALEAQMRAGFAETGRGFAEMRFRLDQVAAGQERILELLTRREGP